jgi:hypothetical protein
MRTASHNPTSNALPPGLNESALVEAITLSGYPLQGAAAHILRKHFGVLEEWDYIDDHTDEHRNLDLLAFRKLESDAGKPVGSLSLHIECKQSRHPFVFFKKVTDVSMSRFLMVAGIPSNTVFIKVPATGGTFDVTPATALGLDLHQFVTQGPPQCISMSRALPKGDKVELTGKDSFRDLIQPIVKGLRYAQKVYAQRNGPSFPVVTLGVAVIAGPLILVEDPTTANDPVLVPWVRLFRRESNRQEFSRTKSRVYGIDIVHADFLATFIADHVLPFAEVARQRMQSHQSVLDGKGTIEGAGAFSWDRVRP